MRRRGWTVGGVLALGLAVAGCDFLDDRLKSCEDVPVDLINDFQTLGSFHIVSEEEGPSPASLLESGASRRIGMCLDKGYRKKFRVFTPTDTDRPLVLVHCQAGRSSYETGLPRVRYTPIGLRCENW